MNKVTEMGRVNPSVSIVTISQYERKDCLMILADLVNNQTYDAIIEWIIVEGSPTVELANLNQIFIESLRKKVKFRIKYIEFEAGARLGRLRNKGNDNCSGEIIVCCDDDDYYPPDRVEHAVSRLMASDRLIAGCNLMFMYDYILERLFQYKGFYNSRRELMEHHSTNNCFAYKQEYLLTHRYDDNASLAEEPSFTNQFSEPMVQLDSDKTIVVSSHNGNTYHKRLIFMLAHKHNELISDQATIAKLLPIHYRNSYTQLFVKPRSSEYDIVYYAGGFGIEWDPRDSALGGSEQAIVNLTTQWRNLGKKVCVYASISGTNSAHFIRPTIIHNGVEYFDWRTFPFEHEFKTLIVWRTFALNGFLDFNVKAKMICLDLHDNFYEGFRALFDKVSHKIDKIFTKSYYHKASLYEALQESYREDKVVVIPNGIQIDLFKPNPSIIRNRYRFCYASCYTRGLEYLLAYTWPLIAACEPRAELHVYYGMNHIFDEKYRNHLRFLLGQERVMDHGRQSLNVVSQEKQQASFHLYTTNSRFETDCLSIRESLVAGAIPVISNVGVFRERDGYHFSIDDTTQERLQASYRNLAYYCLALLNKSESELATKRQELANSPTITTWEQTAVSWLAELIYST